MKSALITVLITTPIFVYLAFAIKQNAEKNRYNAKFWFATSLITALLPLLFFIIDLLFFFIDGNLSFSIAWGVVFMILYPCIYLAYLIVSKIKEGVTKIIFPNHRQPLLSEHQPTYEYSRDVPERELVTSENADTVLQQITPDEQIPAKCPHCESLNINKLKVCEWCGNKMC